MAIVLSELSTEYVIVPVAAVVDGQQYNPTGDQVQFAFKPVGTDPQTADWVTGSWASTSAVNGAYQAQCLVGPANGGNVYAQGIYQIWLKITDNPEVPVRSPGLLQITQ